MPPSTDFVRPSPSPLFSAAFGSGPYRYSVHCISSLPNETTTFLPPLYICQTDLPTQTPEHQFSWDSIRRGAFSNGVDDEVQSHVGIIFPQRVPLLFFRAHAEKISQQEYCTLREEQQSSSSWDSTRNSVFSGFIFLLAIPPYSSIASTRDK